MKMHTFWFECTDNGGGHQAFEVRAFAKKHAVGDWKCKMISEWTT